jgi:type II secretory pathway component PulF
MALFAYKGTGADGQKRTGEVEAGSRSEALRRLALDRIQPLSLVAKSEMAGASGPTLAARVGRHGAGPVRLRSKDLILFTDELADFINSGLQLEPALQLMANREARSPVKDVSAILREKVRDGTSFSDALRVSSPSFDELYCNLVAAGEVSGALAPLLRRQSIHLLAMEDLRGRVTLALIYPTALVLGGAGAMAVFMTVLVPQMIKLFAKTGGAMPLPTQVLVDLSGFAQHYGLYVVIFIAVVAGLFTAYIGQPSGRRWWDETKLKFPLLGPLLSTSFYAEFCQILANLLQNGLPLLTALKLVSGATPNVFYRGLLLKITDFVAEGASLSRAMKSVGHFPADLRDLVKVGEQTGDLGGVMGKVGERFEKDIKKRVDTIMQIVPLLITAALGGMVLLIAWSMLDGIFQAMHGLQGRH